MKTGENTFIDDALWQQFLNYCEYRLDETIKKDK